jgi:hypothetical protein
MKEATSSVIRGRPEAAVASADTSHADRRRIGGLIFYVVALTLLFSEPLVRLVAHAFGNNLHSHIPLVPLIAAYLLYARPRGHVAPYELSVGGAVVSAAVGSGALVIGIALKGALSVNDEMAVLTLAYLGFLITGGFLFLGAKWMTSAAFPISFLVFMIPLPDAAVYWLERASVLASADASALLFKVTGTPLLRDSLELGALHHQPAGVAPFSREPMATAHSGGLRDSARDRAQRISDSGHRTTLRAYRAAHDR